MKKFFTFVFISILIFGTFSCSKKKAASTQSTEAEIVNNTEIQKIQEPEQIKETEKIDLDLSNMNYNMLSSVLFDLMTMPENYENKRIKISGGYYESEYEGKKYFSVITWDATACCPAGIDFVPPDTMKYPDDFPAQDQQITVTGLLKNIEEDGVETMIFQAEKIIKG